MGMNFVFRLILVVTFALVLVGCDNGSGTGTSDSSSSSSTVGDETGDSSEQPAARNLPTQGEAYEQ